MLTVIDEYMRECLVITAARNLTSDDVLQVLTDLFVERAPPDHIRSDNGGEFTAKVVRRWFERIGVRTLPSGTPSRARQNMGELSHNP
jgi:transposase InsO family protein